MKHAPSHALIRGAFLFAAFASFANAQNETWFRQFGSNGQDYVFSAAPDGSGGVYLGGNTVGSLGGPSAGLTDVWLARYDAAGNQTWIRQLGSNSYNVAWGAASDGSGGVYVSGSTSGSLGGPSAGLNDAWLSRYDGAGNQTWIRQFGTSSYDGAYTAASDGSGGVYVSGYTDGSLGGPHVGSYDVWLARYDSAGNQIWLRQLGSNDRDWASAAALDGLGGVYVTGYTDGSLGGPNAGGYDAWVARYDGAGNQTWIRQFGPSFGDTAAASDGSGGVYVSGITRGSLGGPNAGGDDVWLARYDSAGNQTWIRQFGSIEFEWARSTAPDGTGGVYVSGSSEGSLGGPNSGLEDVWLARYDGAGNQTWIRQFGTSDWDFAYAATSDDAGGVYVSGITRGSLGGPNAGSDDVWLARYDSAGSQTWIRQFGSSYDDRPVAVAPDGSGGVYVAGSTGASLGGPSAGGYDVWLARYDGAGNQSWIRQFGTSNDDAAIAATAPDGSGGVYVSGSTSGSLGGPSAGLIDAWLARYDPSGNQVWIRQLGTSNDDAADAAAPDGSGGVYVSGETSGSLGGPHAGREDAWLARYDSAGNQTWIRQLGTSGDDAASAAASDGSGGVYVSGFTSDNLVWPSAGDEDAWLARYDSAGHQTWIRQFGSFDDDRAVAAAPDGSGGVYLSGFTEGSLGGPHAGLDDVWLARLNSAGNYIWIRQLGTSDDDAAYAAASDGSGGVYVSGITRGSLGDPNAGGYDAWFSRYDSAGYQTWIRQFGTSNDDTAVAAAPDGSGEVFVAGAIGASLGGLSAGNWNGWLAHFEGGLSTVRYCTPAVLNSTGQSGALTAFGSNAVQANNVTLVASHLSLNSFGFFLTSRDQGNTYPVNNSQGRLCLGGLIGRYVGAGQIKNSGPTGSFWLPLDLTAMAHPFNPVVAQAGQTWYFQAWHRDANPTSTSNFTDAVSITFQ